MTTYQVQQARFQSRDAFYAAIKTGCNLSVIFMHTGRKGGWNVRTSKTVEADLRRIEEEGA